MHGTDVFHHILRLADWLHEPVFTFDEVCRWPAGLLEQFVRVGLLQKIERAREVCCDSCDEGNLLVPDIRYYPVIGKTIAVAKCPECGRVTIELDRLRQWEVHFRGLATHLAESLCNGGCVAEIVPRRVWLLGWTKYDGWHHDVFLARGLTRPDALDVIRRAERLHASRCAAVVMFKKLPVIDFWPGRPPAAASLVEIASWNESGLRIEWDVLFRQQIGGSSNADDDDDTEPAVVLTEAEMNILIAIATSPNQTMQLAEVMAGGGYGKQATRKGLARLRELGFVAKPEGTQRKGDVVTSQGRAFFARDEVASRNT